MTPLPPARELSSRAARHKNKIALSGDLSQVTTALHSPDFIRRWKEMLSELYGYREREGVLRVPGLTGGSTAVHVPLLSYSDLTLNQGLDLRDRLAGDRYQVRVLDGSNGGFAPNETVTMRMDLSCGSVENVFNGVIPSKCRNLIRKSEQAGLSIRCGVEPDLVDDFYRVFATTMHRFGTPVFSKRLFSLLPKFVDIRYLVGYKDGVPISALSLVMDEKIGLVPWAGSLMEYRTLRPNHRLYWNAIQLTTEAGKPVFDFGRSGYLGATYVFKEEWGAIPVRVVTLSSSQSEVYSKYTLASNVWKRLPRVLVDAVGPRLCRYLPDL
jgi:Acetyltransferase (GNAT) domain